MQRLYKEYLSDKKVERREVEMLTGLYLRARELFKAEEGATAVEYGIMVALIAVVIIATVALLGNQLVAVFQRVVSALTGV